MRVVYLVADEARDRLNFGRDAFLVELVRIEATNENRRAELMACKMSRNTGGAV
jgi:hypothetical protein